MYSISDLKIGTHININNEPYTIIWAQHTKLGRGGAILRTKIKNLKNGKVLEKTFKGSEKIEEAILERSKANFLYIDEKMAHFMNNSSYEQFSIDKDILGNKINFLKEGTDVDILYFKNQPVSVDIPIKVDLLVTSAPKGVRGDTAQGSATKPIKLETGVTINAPLFIKEGDIVRVNTETGEYVERVQG